MHSRTFIKKRPVKISLYRFSVLNSCTDFLSDVVFLHFRLSPCLYLYCTSNPFSFLPFSCPTSLGADVSGATRRRISVPVSTLAQTHARFGKTRDLPRQPFSGDHGKLLVRIPSRSPPEPSAGGLHLRQLCSVQTSFSQEANMSPRSRLFLTCHHFHLALRL